MSVQNRLGLAAVIGLPMLVRLLLGLGMEGPIIHGDEAGYILNGRWLAGEGPAPGTRYFPGYSFLLVPAAWLTQSPLGFYKAILVTNALLGGLFSLAAWGLTDAFLKGRTIVRLMVTAAVSLYPSSVLFSSLALSENALSLATMLTAYLVKRSVDGDDVGPMPAVGLGVLSAYQLIVHPRGAAVLFATGLVALTFWRPWWRRRVAFALLAGSSAVVLVLGAVVVNRATSGGVAVSDGYSLRVVASSRLSLSGVLGIGTGALGQVLYLVAGTYGLVVIGFCAGTRQVREWMSSKEKTGAAAVALFSVTTSLVVLVMSAWLVAPGNVSPVKPDSLIYGRLNEGVLGPLLLVGLCVLGNEATATRRSALARYASVAAFAAVMAAVPVQLAGKALDGRIDNPIGVTAVYPLQAALAGGRVAPLLMAGFAVLSVATLAAIARWRPMAAVASVAAAFLLVTTVLGLRYLLPGSARRSSERGAVALVAEVEERIGSPPQCVAFDDADFSFWHYDNYRVFLPGTRIERFASQRGETPCGPMVITTREDFRSVFPEARLWRKLDEGLSVWILPGRLQEVTSDLLAVANQ